MKRQIGKSLLSFCKLYFDALIGHTELNVKWTVKLRPFYASDCFRLSLICYCVW